jgi:[protein-PII] uridylyltransferase
MPSTPSISGELRELSTKELTRIKEQFAATGDGKAALLGRTALIEFIIERLWKQHVFPETNGPADFAIVALGGFGRRWLFPFSDVDVLFLHAGNGIEESFNVPPPTRNSRFHCSIAGILQAITGCLHDCMMT